MRTWVEISKKNILKNINQVRRLIGNDVKLMSVVKSNAYGHGLLEVAKTLEKHVDWFGVDSLMEGIALRNSRIKKPILILGYTEIESLNDLLKFNLRQTIYNQETVDLMHRLHKISNQIFKVHIKIETGTNRQGVQINNLSKFIDNIKKKPGIEIEGISTHFANIEDTTDHSYAEYQLQNFIKAKQICEQLNVKLKLCHTACSAAAILFPETHFNMVRLGISQYGHWSSKETLAIAKKENRETQLFPALTWKTVIAQIKAIPAGSCISYGCSEKITKNSKIAIIPVGYWDGLDRGLSSIGNVLVKGQRCKVLGRICMNMCIIDVSDVRGVKIQDEVVIIGKQGKEEISAEEIGSKINTINYEVLTRVNPLIKRIII